MRKHITLPNNKVRDALEGVNSIWRNTYVHFGVLRKQLLVIQLQRGSYRLIPGNFQPFGRYLRDVLLEGIIPERLKSIGDRMKELSKT